ncbi:MAG: PEGA domain-containing protein, partial [Myxococcales bacterium]|nr:PEGA domain-containing protein [Myxococcales bacterium]
AAAAAAAAPDQGTDGAATSERVRVIASAPPTPRRARAKARPRRRSSTRRPARRRAQPQRAIAFGSLAIQSKSAAGTHLWANVLLDGKPVGRTPLTLERVRVGRHLVVVRRAGYTPARAWVWVRPGQRSRARLRLSAAGR